MDENQRSLARDPASSTKEGAGLHDFWATCDAAYDGVAADVARDSASAAAPLKASAFAAHTLEARGLFRRAIEGDWAPYEASLRALGASFANAGASFTGWHELVCSFWQRFLPLVVQAYASAPERLVGALAAMQQIHSRRMRVLGEEYLRTKEAAVLEAEAARLTESGTGPPRPHVLAIPEKQQAPATIEQRSQERDTHARLRESEERFRLLISGVKDYAIFMLDPSGHVTSWNAGAERMKGYAADEIIGQSYSRFYPKEDLQDGKPERLLRVAATEGRCEDEGWRIRKDGSRFLAHVVITRLTDADSKIVGFSKITRDVTERQLAEASLKAANRELEAFSYSVAHDLRAPLRAMNGFAQLVLSEHADKLDAEGQDWLQEILLNARHMGELIDALLSLARVTRAELKVQRVDPAEIARGIAAQLQSEEPSRSVDWIIEADVRVDADPHLVRALLANLLANAWKFTRNVARPRIAFSVHEEHGIPTFTVRDNGAGFDMTYASKLFAPFQRLHTTEEFPGTGIGLATVQRIVARHGGRVRAEGVVGEGAAFHFTLSSLPGAGVEP